MTNVKCNKYWRGVTNVKKNKSIFMFFAILSLAVNIQGTNTVLAGASKPSDTFNLSDSGKYKGAGECNTVNLYSNYYFAGVSSMKISVTNNFSSKQIKVKVYKKAFLLDSCVSTVTIPASGNTTRTINTSKSEKNYVKFFKPADFSWSIQKG